MFWNDIVMWWLEGVKDSCRVWAVKKIAFRVGGREWVVQQYTEQFFAREVACLIPPATRSMNDGGSQLSIGKRSFFIWRYAHSVGEDWEANTQWLVFTGLQTPSPSASIQDNLEGQLSSRFPCGMPVTGKHVINATTVCSSTSASDTSCFPPSLTGADLKCIPRKTTCWRTEQKTIC